ncbi:hypothetical protein MRX96_013114 [Rhipicephalus microplus]
MIRSHTRTLGTNAQASWELPCPSELPKHFLYLRALPEPRRLGDSEVVDLGDLGDRDDLVDLVDGGDRIDLLDLDALGSLGDLSDWGDRRDLGDIGDFGDFGELDQLRDLDDFGGSTLPAFFLWSMADLAGARAVEDAEWRISRNLTRAMAERGHHLSAPVQQSTVETIPDDSGAFCEMIFVPGLPNGSSDYQRLSEARCPSTTASRASLVEPARGVEGGGPEDEPRSGFTIAPLVRFCLMATFQGRCNTKEPQPLSRPVWLLPAQSKDGPVALPSALSGGYRGLSGRACTINHHREQPA